MSGEKFVSMQYIFNTVGLTEDEELKKVCKDHYNEILKKLLVEGHKLFDTFGDLSISVRSVFSAAILLIMDQCNIAQNAHRKLVFDIDALRPRMARHSLTEYISIKQSQLLQRGVAHNLFNRNRSSDSRMKHLATCTECKRKFVEYTSDEIEHGKINVDRVKERYFQMYEYEGAKSRYQEEIKPLMEQAKVYEASQRESESALAKLMLYIDRLVKDRCTYRLSVDDDCGFDMTKVLLVFKGKKHGELSISLDDVYSSLVEATAKASFEERAVTYFVK